MKTSRIRRAWRRSRQTEMDAISLPEAIPDDVPEDSVADVEESIGGGDGAGDANELEVSNASYLECL
jgi:hypothetical protein